MFGVNARLSVTLCPAATVAGKLGAVTEKFAFDTVALLMVTAADPEFVAVTVSVLVAPVITLPKSMLAFARDRSPICGWVSLGELPALSPWQPARKDRPKRSINSCAVVQDFCARFPAECTDGDFGFIGGHEPSPLQRVNSVSGEDCQQCGPVFPNRKDFGGTYLLVAKGRGPNRDWPKIIRETAVSWCAKSAESGGKWSLREAGPDL